MCVLCVLRIPVQALRRFNSGGAAGATKRMVLSLLGYFACALALTYMVLQKLGLLYWYGTPSGKFVSVPSTLHQSGS